MQPIDNKKTERERKKKEEEEIIKREKILLVRGPKSKETNCVKENGIKLGEKMEGIGVRNEFRTNPTVQSIKKINLTILIKKISLQHRG